MLANKSWKSRRDGGDAFLLVIDDKLDNMKAVNTEKWRGQSRNCTLYKRGDDLVVVNARGEFVTVMRGGASNVRYRRTIGRLGD